MSLKCAQYIGQLPLLSPSQEKKIIQFKSLREILMAPPDEYLGCGDDLPRLKVYQKTKPMNDFFSNHVRTQKIRCNDWAKRGGV